VILVLRREAEADILEAFRWYESKHPGLGHAFVDVVDGAFERLAEAPSSCPVAYRDLRRLVLRRFPYVVYFRQVEDMVQVFGVIHGRRELRVLRERSVLP
jgi:plasmid stabilization system protein ParE